MTRIESLFPTLIYQAALVGGRRGAVLNRRLLQECGQLQQDDIAGRRWSARNYPGGYTSYGSLCKMQQISPIFAELERYLAKHVAIFTENLGLDLRGRPLSMTDCWVNVMPRGVVHSLHLHPLSTLSGTYYVQVPRGSPGLKFEDPRLDRFMAAPPRRANAAPAWHTVPASAGRVVLFESWLRHEVTANAAAADRISISFNFNWF